MLNREKIIFFDVLLCKLMAYGFWNRYCKWECNKSRTGNYEIKW